MKKKEKQVKREFKKWLKEEVKGKMPLNVLIIGFLCESGYWWDKEIKNWLIKK